MTELLSRYAKRTEKHMWNEGATVRELNKSCFFICACVSVYKWMHVADPDDSDWVMQGRVCALSVRLLFHSHMDLGLRWSQPDYLIQCWAATTLIPQKRKAVDHCAHKLLMSEPTGSGECRWGLAPIFHPSLACWLCRRICLGQNVAPPGRELCVGGKCSHVLKSEVRVQGL